MSASAKRNSLLRCLIIKKTAEHMMSITISVEPASHTHAHNREIIVTCCAALGAVAARHMRHLSLCGWCSCRDTPSAALLRRCCRASRANMDQPRTPPTYGRHRKRMARPVANVQRAHSLRPRGSSLRSSLFQGARASTSDGLFSLTGADPLVDFTVSYFLSFRQRNQCKRERWDRILAQVNFFNEVPCPPALRCWSACGL